MRAGFVSHDFSQIPTSPLVLSHQLLALAEQADRAGLPTSARALLKLAHHVCVDPARGQAKRARHDRRRSS